MQFLSSLITSYPKETQEQQLQASFLQQVNQTQNLNSTAIIETYSEDNSDSDEGSNYFMIGGILCLLLSVCICGIISEAYKKKKAKLELQTKLLETTFVQQDFTPILTRIQQSIESSNWVLKTYLESVHTSKTLTIKCTTVSRNKLELLITQVNKTSEWLAEGHLEVKSDEDIQIYMRCSTDDKLLPFCQNIDSLYLLQTYSGNFYLNEYKFEGAWCLYGTNFDKNSCINGEFQIERI